MDFRRGGFIGRSALRERGFWKGPKPPVFGLTGSVGRLGSRALSGRCYGEKTWMGLL